VEARPTVQRMPAGGGWVNGDAAVVGDNPTDEAVITYYQQKRHIFGDLKIEILDSTGKVLSTVPSSKRRGLNRATWSMRLKAPRVPTAASAAFGATIGPRVLPGTYTVKMSKDKNVYTTQLVVTGDPRSKYTAADRKAQFDLSMKLYNLLADMTFAVDRLNSVRLALDADAAKLPANDPLVARARAASAAVDVLRKKIVATKEGGAITGEERLRENLADLHGNVNNYEGRPTQTQVERTDAISRELADVVRDFDAWLAKELPGLNSALTAKQLTAIKVITREEWEKR
ncbi:MAG TPA: T9SS type A sorting domain-containing protein, partial [Pyrinomonadaceae bacterium]|nr:T9SS type A sorting domain-containing protein [Pyrinomonadaceae bacterium]